jgi:hypothetical protein
MDESASLMPSDLLGAELILREVAWRSGLAFAGGRWIRVDAARVNRRP